MADINSANHELRELVVRACFMTFDLLSLHMEFYSTLWLIRD